MSTSPPTPQRPPGMHASIDDPMACGTITDVGSTNGTYLGAGFTQLQANHSTVLTPGAPVYLGAWTRIELTPTDI